MSNRSEEDQIEFEASFDSKEEALIRTRLIALQDKIREANVPVVLVLCGVNGSGKNAMLGILRDWLDQRALVLRAYEQSAIRQESMEYRHYWKDTPAKGKTGVFVSSWYSEPLVSRAYDKINDDDLYKRLDQCNAFEKTLTDSGVLFCKIWFYKNRAEQEQFLRSLDEDVYEKWRVMSDDWKNCCASEGFEETTKKIIRYTNKEDSPWVEIKEGSITERIREGLDVFCKRVEKAIDKAAEQKNSEKEKNKEAKEHKEEKSDKKSPEFLKKIDLSLTVSKDEYREKLPYLRSKLNALLMEAKKRNKRVMLVFEGPDASGKGGVISRLTSSVYVRDCSIFPISAPTQDELSHHYLWRFWDRLSDQKLLTVFDRSWYGRVLVERIEHFATNAEWKRAYDEINDFEKLITKSDTIVAKFLLYISKEEQLSRFKAREETAYKAWKIGGEDWRNREKWEQYEEAFDDMLAKTDTKSAPWFVVPNNMKKYGRIKTMEILCDLLEKELDFSLSKEIPVPDLKDKDKDKDKKKS